MRRQNRPKDPFRALPLGDVKTVRSEKNERKAWDRGWIFVAWRQKRKAALSVLTFLALLFNYGVVFPFLYERVIRRYPEFVFRKRNVANAAATAMFYHIYVPLHKGKAGIRQALDIVQEQLTQLADSTNSKPFELYYTTTGMPHVAQRHTEQVCATQGLPCHWMGHWENGQEELTLSRLYAYCQQYPASSVLYIHTKGSFHTNNGRNHAWRWHLTRAALTCAWKMRTRQCNVCGLQFYPVWTTFFPGNMWTASCTYINQLWAPEEFGPMLKKAVTSARGSDRFTWSLFNASNPSILGLGRYSMEHWVGSHPSLRPCDIIASSPNLEQWYNRSTAHSDFVTEAPQRTWYDIGWFRWNVSIVQEVLDSENKFKEYFLLPGLLYKWKLLYGQIPADDSWVWKWYPRGYEMRGVAWGGG